MEYLLSKKYDETFTINFIGTEKLSYGTSLNLKIEEPINGVLKINKIDYKIDGKINDKQYLKIYFKFKNSDNELVPCDSCWSDNLEIDKLSGLTLNSNESFDFQLFVYRIDDSNSEPTDIWISNIIIYGEYNIDKTDSLAIINENNSQIILSPKDIYKVFSVDNFETIIRGEIENIDIKFRVTQDNGRSYSQWESLTKENISTFRFNELRFAKIEYLISQIEKSNNLTKVYDIILIGDFQNVSANYLKNNRYGLREDCLTTYYNNNPSESSSLNCGIPQYGSNSNNSNNSNVNNYDLKMNFYTQGLSCYIHSTTTQELNLENQENQNTMWNPYETSKINELANKIANDINSIFAWKVDYHLTDPDENGIDVELHEYQLYNIIDVKNIKILVPENKFPDNTVKMQKFNLDLFDTFEIHILKDEFKNNFGIDKRPAENDIIFFCELNRLYRVKHAQVFREIMNAGIYWKVILEKYEQKSNIRNLSEESKVKIDKLTKNTTLEELFGPEIKSEEDKIANKQQTKPITRETIRQIISKNVIVIQESLYNGNNDFAKYYYNFKNISGKSAISYQKFDNELKLSDNRSFISWFNFNNDYIEDDPMSIRNAIKTYSIDINKNYNLLNNYDDNKKLGYRYWFNRNKIIFQINDKFYQMKNLNNLKTNIWYGLVINLNQRQNNISMYLYKRPGEYNIKMNNPETSELATVLSNDVTGYTYLTNIGFKPYNNEEIHNISTEFELLYNQFINIEPNEFVKNSNIELIGSNIKYTNLRIFNDIIPLEKINNILNQVIISDENKLILSDNSNRRLYSDNFPRNKWD